MSQGTAADDGDTAAIRVVDHHLQAAQPASGRVDDGPPEHVTPADTRDRGGAGHGEAKQRHPSTVGPDPSTKPQHRGAVTVQPGAAASVCEDERNSKPGRCAGPNIKRQTLNAKRSKRNNSNVKCQSGVSRMESCDKPRDVASLSR